MKILSSALVLVTSLSKLNFGLSQIPDQDLVQITSDGKDLGRTAIAASSSSLQMGGIIDLSKDFELSSFHNQSPGAQKVIEQAETSLTIKSVLVIEGGKLVASYYRRFPFVDPTEPLIVHSITKSVVSLLMGILLRDGSLSSLDETLGDIFTDEKVWEGVPDVANRKSITIKEMLTMTSGLNYDMVMPQDCKGLNVWLTSPTTGVKGEYNYMIKSSILSYVILNRTGMTPRELLSTKVLPFLGISDDEIEWHYTMTGSISHDFSACDIEPAYNGLSLTATQMAKIGMLYLQKGVAGPEPDQTVVSSDFIEASFTRYVDTPSGEPYGFLWRSFTSTLTNHAVGESEDWCALGAFGQFICVDSVQDRVVVQQREWAGDDYDASWPVFVALDPSLSFDEAPAAGCDWTGCEWGGCPTGTREVESVPCYLSYNEYCCPDQSELS